MSARSTILLLLIVGAVFLLCGVGLIFFHTGTQRISFDRTVQLSNSAYLRLHGTPSWGPDSGDDWEVLYRDGSSWEKAGNWWGGDWWGGNDGNIVACPLGRLVVIVKSNGSQVLVRTETREWKNFLMTIPLEPPGSAHPSGPQTTWLETAELNSILGQMSIPAGAGLLHPEVAGFHPATREAWLDYVTKGPRLYRVRLRLLENGERFKLISVEERPDTLHLEFPDKPDPDLDSTCTAIQFTHRLRE